jgi:23S rRNA (cytosine1962-C5)-methyltransferase
VTEGPATPPPSSGWSPSPSKLGEDLTPITLIGEPWSDYALLDSGHGRKLERYGPYRFIRPEPQALWAPASPEWHADGKFVPGADEDGGGRWDYSGQHAAKLPQHGWSSAWEELTFNTRPTPFRHLGYFPDMAPVWTWMRAHAPASALNLFGYTGVGSLALAATGAAVTHVDASKKSVDQARTNAALSQLHEAPIRWIVDDAAKFAAREVRRGKRYDGIILDPPKFGRGPEGEVWRLEEGLPGLIADCRRLLDGDSKFLFLTVYAVRMSALAIGELVRQACLDLGGTVECGELGVREEARGLILPTAIFARWSR